MFNPTSRLRDRCHHLKHLSINFYIGLSGTSFKERYNNHKRDFRKKSYEKSIELSKYIWRLKESGIEFTIHWKILSHVERIVTAYNKQRDFKRKYSMDKLYCIRGIYNLILVQVADSQAKI